MTRSIYPDDADSAGLHFVFPYAVRSVLCHPKTPSTSNNSLKHAGNATRIQINACVSRGLRFDSGRWVAYRRNYLAVTVAVKFDIPLLRRAPTSRFSSHLHRQMPPLTDFTFSVQIDRERPLISVPVKYFTTAIYAEDESTSRPISLVQHTSKRDNGPRRDPVMTRISPTMGDGRILATPVGNPLPTPGSDLNSDFPYEPSEIRLDGSVNGSSIHAQEVVCFERIQFKQATANNGRKNTAQQTFRLVAVLYAAVSESDLPEPLRSPEITLSSGQEQQVRYFELQRVSTSGIMVRGRSPGHYAKRGGLIQ
ncbi:hypothetical protein V1512DRAFT_268962 [Lipomyces arxii]|uniref:uncharacterized protein n=1 Tax=Lipomyces arxii TaxID=56418 RepID=UPI0034CE31F8